jgi:hypothetical protein
MIAPLARPLLESLGACDSAVEWAGRRRLSAASWRGCERGDWMLWLAARVDVPHKRIVLAACAAARYSLHLVPVGEDRPRIAIETAERWARGRATLDEVRAAAADASAYAAYAADAADAYAAYAADATDAYAAYAADAADAYAADAADAYAAHAVYASTYASYAAYAAYTAHTTKTRREIVAHTTKTWREIAAIVRRALPWPLVRSYLLRAARVKQ